MFYLSIITTCLLLLNNFTYADQPIACRKPVKNIVGMSALNQAIERKDYKSALQIAATCSNINQRDPFTFGSPQKVNALERLFYHVRVKQGPKIYPSNEELELANLLLDRGIDVKSSLDVFSPIITACCFEIEDMIVRLVNMGVNVNACHGLSLYYLIGNGNLDQARFLIANGANYRLNHYPLFYAAISSQKLESIDFLLSFGLELSKGHYIRHAFNFIQTEIQHLDGTLQSSFPAVEMLIYLLENGANPNDWITSKHYETAIDLCALSHVLELPADTNAQYFYKNYVIQNLLNYGAITPDRSDF